VRAVVRAQRELVKLVRVLRPVLSYKGASGGICEIASDHGTRACHPPLIDGLGCDRVRCRTGAKISRGQGLYIGKRIADMEGGAKGSDSVSPRPLLADSPRLKERT
jgi:hypothetical protein